MTHKNLGRLAVDLKLEDRVLEEDLLPEKMVDKSEFATAIIDRLIEKGDWLKASRLLFGNGPLKHIYDGNKADLELRLVKSVTAKEFEASQGYSGDAQHRFYTNIKFLIENISQVALTALVSREDLPVEVTESLLGANKHAGGISDEVYSANMTRIGKQIQEKKPWYAHKLFSHAGDKQGIRDLYDSLDRKFDLENVTLMLQIAEQSHAVDNYGEKVESIVRRAIPLLEKIDEKTSGDGIVSSVKSAAERYQMELSDQEKELLEMAEVKHFSEYTLREKHDSISPKIRLSWALNKFSSSPTLAYEIFCEENYAGKESLECARRIFQDASKQYRGLPDSVEIKKEHLEAILSELPKEDARTREIIALRLKDKTELLRLAELYADESGAHRNGAYPDMNKAYQLMQSGEADESALRALRKRMIEKELDDRRKTGLSPYFLWLQHDDKKGYDQAFDALIAESQFRILESAYELAHRNNDPSRVTMAREKILKTASSQQSLKFFASKTDPVGYDAALDLVSKEYDVPKDMVNQLFAKKEKAKVYH